MPSLALLPDLESEYNRRSKWLALRHAFSWYGANGLHTLNFFFWVGAYGNTAPTGYAIYGTVGAVLIALAILVSTLGTQTCGGGAAAPAGGRCAGARSAGRCGRSSNPSETGAS